MISTITETNNQVTKYVISSFDQNNMPINESVLQNVVYKIKMDLKNDHPLYENLPYYWYCNGPFSETLRNSFNALKKFLKPVDDYFLLDEHHFNDSKLDIVSQYDEIEDATWELISKGDYVYSSLSQDIYRNLAPLDMLYTFKFDIFEPTCKSSFLLDGDEYVCLFRNCQYQITPIYDLNEYSLIFTKLVRQIDILNDEGVLAEKWNIIKQPIRNLWFTFAQALRCLNHDSYYDGNYSKWESLFNVSLSNLDDCVDNFILESEDWIDFSQVSDLTEEEIGFISPIMNIYLEDDNDINQYYS